MNFNSFCKVLHVCLHFLDCRSAKFGHEPKMPFTSLQRNNKQRWKYIGHLWLKTRKDTCTSFDRKKQSAAFLSLRKELYLTWKRSRSNEGRSGTRALFCDVYWKEIFCILKSVLPGLVKPHNHDHPWCSSNLFLKEWWITGDGRI